MKTYIFLLFFLVCSMGLGFSQNQASDFTGNKSDQPRNPRVDLMNFVPNEVLVKFKDAVPVTAGARVKAAGISSVDQVLKAHGITSLEKLFPTAQKPLHARMMKSPQGKDMKIPALDKIYRVSVPPAQPTDSMPNNIFQLIEELKALPEVEYAEPNYIYSIDKMQPVGSVLTAEDVAKMQISKQNSSTTAVTPNDPLYGQQWYIPAVKADSVWQQTTGDTTQVIAILDTGVDWNHPDLKNKIWTNPNPATSWNQDGILNDVRGWDYINNDNNPMDDNSHGTHVAGIAAAETNNGIGIAGVNWKAKIMPIKVFQSSGRGDAATIAKGIIYASTHGATVINMSFGSYASSFAMEDALANAYATTLLVAAAGNDGLDIGDCPPGGPFFPAALSYVLGIQSPEASFSNSDCTGPTFSNSSELFNYEMKAPGTNIISTIPNGNYRVYQGTSMAAPIVSGALSLYRKLIPYDTETNEFMWVKLIQATDYYLNINKALTINPKPEIWFLNKVMVDTIGIDDKDGRVDAGETIQLWFMARNTGGQVDSVYWKIRLAEFEDPTTCNIVKPTSYLGSISPYATRTSENDPMILNISSNVAHGRDITFDLLSWYKGTNDTVIQKFVLTPENGEQLSGVLDGVKILYPNRLYLVNNSYKVSANGTLIVKPGTKILFYPGKSIPVNGRLIIDGKPDSLIQLIGYPYSETSFTNRNGNNRKMSYCRFENFTNSGCLSTTSNCSFYKVLYIIVDSLMNCDYYNYSSDMSPSSGCIGSFNYLYKNNIVASSPSSPMWTMKRGGNRVQFCPIFYEADIPGNSGIDKQMKYNNFINLSMCNDGAIQNTNSNYQNSWIGEFMQYGNGTGDIFYNDTRSFLAKYSTNYQSSDDFQSMKYQYWGTNDSSKIESFIIDFMEEPTWPRARFQPYLSAPPDSCHGVVWKVLINGKDGQDQLVDPLGVGKQKFEIYFNKPMDKTVNPTVSFGVRYPYNQQIVKEEGRWSENGRIYTVYKTIKVTSGDGINRIRVSGAKDLEGWEIPLEDMRFEFLINAATSSSVDFMATPGLGKVNLEWNNNDLQDGLGYNMYRMEHINDSTLTEAVMINPTLITDTLYTDFSVTPNKKYYYYYKIVRTDLSETDQSKVVSAIPFTASKGDANGDLSVNVLDITSIVAYLLNNNPQPFIFDAADVNSDATINVLDIVGVVNLVLNGPQKVKGISLDQQANLYLENDTLFADANVPIGGIQLDINGVSSTEDIHALKALDGFESGYSMKNDTLRLLYYSMSGKSIPAGNHIPLLVMKPGNKIVNAVFGTTNGSPIRVNFLLSRIPDISDNMNQTVAELGQNFPNPLNGLTTIPIHIYEPVDEVLLRVVNVMGQEVEIIRLVNPYIGEHLLSWNPGTNKGLFVYTLEVRNGNQKQICPNKKMIVQ